MVYLVKKLLVVGIILLLICVSIPSTGKFMEQPSMVSSNGITLYVGGSGPGNYSKIQYALNDASDGDTVFVYDGTYFENVVVHTSINLIGEDRKKTIIERNWIDDVVHIFADRVTISGFKIYCSDVDIACINISSNSIIIKENIVISRGGDGIIISGGNNITITNNIFKETYYDNIWIENSNNIRITNNTIYGTINSCIDGHKITDLMIVGNTFINPYEMGGWDISPGYSTNCLIKRNTFNSDWGGIYLFNCKKCVVTENNFMDEDQHWVIILVYFFPNIPIKNKYKFDNNYWFKPRSEPKLIIGEFSFSPLLWFIKPFFLIIPIFHYDKNPAQEPYDIEV